MLPHVLVERRTVFVEQQLATRLEHAMHLLQRVVPVRNRAQGVGELHGASSRRATQQPGLTWSTCP
ncbi:hypothetical protein HALA3H3_p30004 [Halomonas sp. A3H3]|nr:hypothetical protein HALA3H3_p30004 [Halomonas sp. A3H3]